MMIKRLSEKLTGERISLERPQVCQELALTVRDHVNSSLKELMPWMDWIDGVTEADSRYEYLKKCDEWWKTGESFVYVIYRKTDYQFIGDISVMKIDEKRFKATLGYWLSTEHTGNGYMQEAVKLLEAELFNKGFNKIIIHTDVLNIKSANVARNLGYHLDGVLREEAYSKKENRFRDFNEFSKLKKEYK